MIHHIWNFCENNLTTKFRKYVFFALGVCSIPYVYLKNVKNIRPIQGAAIHLPKKEISIALEIFFESILSLEMISTDWGKYGWQVQYLEN